MAQLQQIQFAETIRAMKRAMKRRPDDDDGDEAYTRAYTNRGNKLKREAKRVHRDRLGEADALSYRRDITHAGYTRPIISTKPLYIDSDGDLHSAASSDAENDFSPVTEDPYHSIYLETLLRPLTAASELPIHPSYSLPYKSTALTQMTAEAEATLRRERANLWKAKAVLQRFRGDADWVPCGLFDAEDGGEALLSGEGEGVEDLMSVEVPSVDTERLAPGEAGAQQNGMDVATQEAGDSGMDAMAIDETGAQGQPETSRAELSNVQAASNGTHVPAANNEAPQTSNASPSPPVPEPAFSEAGSASATTNQHAMTTRARARSPEPTSVAPSSPSPSDSLSLQNPPPIHPWFLTPASSHPAQDLSLPPQEAEDARRLLVYYVQKQEQIVRSASALFSGLQRAERSRRGVYEACKAEGHVVSDGRGGVTTEMSDGEDWVDAEALGLGEDGAKGLEKGKDEVDDIEEENAPGGNGARGGVRVVGGRRGGRRRVVG